MFQAATSTLLRNKAPDESLSLLKCSAQHYMLSLSSSFRTGTKHTQPTFTHLHIQQSRWREKIIPFFFLRRQLKSTEEQWAAILLFSWWIKILFKAFQWYECGGKTSPTGDAAMYPSYKEFIIWKAFCSSNLNAEVFWQEFCRADGSSKLVLSDLFSSVGARAQASSQKAAVLNQPIVTQGTFNSDNLHARVGWLPFPVVDRTTELNCCLRMWVLSGGNGAESRVRWKL